MQESGQDAREVNQFILDQIESVPHLEALLLLWNSKPRAWSVQDLAHRLYVDPRTAEKLLRDLAQQGLVQTTSKSREQFQYSSTAEKERLVQLLDQTYRRDIIRISTLIHSKPSSAVRDFARAFRFKKERE